MMALEVQGDERAVLQPGGNCVRNYLQESKTELMKRHQPLENSSLTYPSRNSAPKPLPCKPVFPHNNYKSKSAPSAILSKRFNANDPHSLNLSTDKQCIIKLSPSSPRPIRNRKKSRNSCVNGGGSLVEGSDNDHDHHSASSLLMKNPAAPGSIAAARREQVNLLRAERKQRIAHYGRTLKPGRKVMPEEPVTPTSQTATKEQKRCSFITPTSDPIYVRYHDQEWGVPVHDDKVLFELLVLAGCQVDMDWTTILKMRNDFRQAFDGFDAESIANFSEKRIASVSARLGMDVNRVRSVVDNSKRVIEIKDECGSLDNYIWGFVNYKAMCPEYKSCRKIPVKTSKSESISKDMVRRKFRNVGPTVIDSFMQAAGLTNDHLVTCPRHAHCLSLAATPPSE